MIVETLKMKSDYTSLEAFGSVLWIWKLKTQPSFYAFMHSTHALQIKYVNDCETLILIVMMMMI